MNKLILLFLPTLLLSTSPALAHKDLDFGLKMMRHGRAIGILDSYCMRYAQDEITAKEARQMIEETADGLVAMYDDDLEKDWLFAMLFKDNQYCWDLFPEQQYQ